MIVLSLDSGTASVLCQWINKKCFVGMAHDETVLQVKATSWVTVKYYSLGLFTWLPLVAAGIQHSQKCVMKESEHRDLDLTPVD